MQLSSAHVHWWKVWLTKHVARGRLALWPRATARVPASCHGSRSSLVPRLVRKMATYFSRVDSEGVSYSTSTHDLIS